MDNILEKLKIAVLAGGYSPERDVSLSSGSLIANSLIRSGHRAVLVDSYLGVEADDAYERCHPRQGENLPDFVRDGGDVNPEEAHWGAARL